MQARRKNEELIRLAEERKKEAEDRRRATDDARREDERREKDAEINARLAVSVFHSSSVLQAVPLCFCAETKSNVRLLKSHCVKHIPLVTDLVTV